MKITTSRALLIVLLSVFAVSLAGVFYTNHVQSEADHRWCQLLNTLDSPGGPQPTSPRGKKIQQQIHDLRKELDCSLE